jgi:hypothetical protein
MPSVRVIICLVAGLLALPILGAAQAPDTLSSGDLKVGGIAETADSGVVRRALGAPLRIQRDTQPNDDGVLLTVWHYRGLKVSFDPDGRRYTVTLTRPGYATARGVRVGDSAEKVRRLYGSPHFSDDEHLLYARSREDFETLGITFFLKNGKVTMIILGEVISVE